MSQIHVSTISEEYYTSPNATHSSDFDPQPIYQQQYAITAQPRTDLNKTQRRPIPINTADWISTPRSILNPTCSTQFLYDVKQIEIQQTVDLRTLMGDCKSGNQFKFRVKVPRAETLFLATELTDPRIIGSSRGFTVELRDSSGQTAFTLRKGRTWGCVPGFLHKLTVDGNDFVGSIEQNFTLLAPQFTVYDAFRQPLCLIVGPHTFCSCVYKEARFQVVSTDGYRPLASIILEWDNPVTDYTVTVTFPLDMDVKLKSLLLGGAFLLLSCPSMTESLVRHRLRLTNHRAGPPILRRAAVSGGHRIYLLPSLRVAGTKIIPPMLYKAHISSTRLGHTAGLSSLIRRQQLRFIDRYTSQ